MRSRRRLRNRRAKETNTVRRDAVYSVGHGEEEVSRRRAGARADQTAHDAAVAERQLIRVRQIELRAIAESRRAQREFPAIDARALNVHREENVGAIEAVVIEEIRGAIQEVIRVQDPSFHRNGHTELVLLIPLAWQRRVAELLLVLDGAESRARERAQRRRLIEVPIKAPKDPMEFRNSHGSANARTAGILNNCA